MSTITANMGVRKAAILIIQLGREKAASVLSHLSEAEVEAVSSEVARLESVSGAESDAVMREFRDMMTAPVVTVTPQTSVMEALALMKRKLDRRGSAKESQLKAARHRKARHRNCQCMSWSPADIDLLLIHHPPCTPTHKRCFVSRTTHPTPSRLDILTAKYSHSHSLHIASGLVVSSTSYRNLFRSALGLSLLSSFPFFSFIRTTLLAPRPLGPLYQLSASRDQHTYAFPTRVRISHPSYRCCPSYLSV